MSPNQSYFFKRYVFAAPIAILLNYLIDRWLAIPVNSGRDWLLYFTLLGAATLLCYPRKNKVHPHE